MADVFISYKKEDRALATAAVAALERAGYSVWWDDRLTPTEHWDRLIEREIEAAKAVLVLWTARSIESNWVRIESNFAAEHTKLVQVRFGGCRPPLAYSMLQRVDLDETAGFVGPQWGRALDWIALLAGRSGAPADAPIDASQAGHAFFDSVYGLSQHQAGDGDLLVPTTLTIAEAMTGVERDLDPIAEAAAPQKVRVKIPPGVSNGTKMRLGGQGARRKDGTSGNLYLVIAIRDADPFQLKERDLHIELPLLAAHAAAGLDKDIRLPGGRLIRVRVPAGVTDGRILRLKECGLPAQSEFTAGDLLVHIRVR